jgi:hypothetical protein
MIFGEFTQLFNRFLVVVN